MRILRRLDAVAAPGRRPGPEKVAGGTIAPALPCSCAISRYLRLYIRGICHIRTIILQHGPPGSNDIYPAFSAIPTDNANPFPLAAKRW
jgi:hypothetical protein